MNLDLVLRKLYKLFGIKNLRIDGGGHVNGTFLKAGLIDEVSLVVAPIVDGTTGNLSSFEVDNTFAKRKATHFRLKSFKRIYNDFLWLRYETASKSH